MILIIDDDSAVRSSLSFMLKRAGYEAQVVPGPREAIEVVRTVAPDLILMDMNFTLSTTGEEGLTLLKQVKVFRPDTPVILMTAWGSIQLAVQGMQAGAFDFITKPWNNAALLQRIETALQLSGTPQEPTQEQSDSFDRSHIIGRSQGLMDVLNTIARIAKTNASVLITGESGTGKELIAEAIHINSQRAKHPFVKVNLGGISQSLFESEMFGHKKGAFTDASADRIGRFEMANKGTIFLDEIGEIPLSTQVKLLRVLETRSFERIGGTETITVDTRVVTATNRDLMEMVRQGTFREDLFYRLDVVTIHLPPLRERQEDIPPLVKYYLDYFAKENGRPLFTVSESAMSALCSYSWPGNIRELKNCMERMVVLTRGSLIDIENVPVNIREKINPGISKTILNSSTCDLEKNEKMLIQRALNECDGNRTRAAEKLGISRRTLHRKLALYDIQ